MFIIHAATAELDVEYEDNAEDVNVEKPGKEQKHNTINFFNGTLYRCTIDTIEKPAKKKKKKK